MYFKRNEPYRYAFSEPIEGILSNEDDKQSNTSIHILDISLSGVKIETDMFMEKNQIIYLTYTILNLNFEKEGTIIWRKKL